MAGSQPGPRYTGLWLVPLSSASGAGLPTSARLYVNGTVVGTASAAAFAVTGALTATTTIASTTTMTAGTGLTVTTGNATLSAAAAEFVAAAGNVRIGNPGAFATTQPQGAVIMGGSSLSGIAPAGAITTAGAIFASDTVVRKIIAASTVSNVET